MSNADPKTADPKADQAKATEKQLTAADAAKLVRRTVTKVVRGKDAAGKPTKTVETSTVPVHADEVLSFKDYGTHVVVVTKDGQKFSSAQA